jgi:hypothetical protein
MKDYLLDIVEHTVKLGGIDLIKIVGTETETKMSSLSEDHNTIFSGEFHNPVPEFIGTFGMPNLSKLNIILNIDEYKEDAKISIIPDGTDPTVPTGIKFENKVGDFKNEYRLMKADIINAKLQNVIQKGKINWDVEINPTNISIQRLKFQASANSEETTFVAKVENGDLKFYFGDPANHAGNFVFQTSVSGKLARSFHYPVATTISILGLSGEKTLRFSDNGVMQITIDSGLGIYNYMIPSHTK